MTIIENKALEKRLVALINKSMAKMPVSSVRLSTEHIEIDKCKADNKLKSTIRFVLHSETVAIVKVTHINKDKNWLVANESKLDFFIKSEKLFTLVKSWLDARNRQYAKGEAKSLHAILDQF